jgi:hypothetical protein
VSGVVIFWATTSTAGLDEVENYAAESGDRVGRVALRDLGPQALAGAALAPVIAVVDDDRAATEALGAGVDEIVRRGDLSRATIEQAVHRAEARARGRLRAMIVPTPRDEVAAFGNLLDWVAIELVSCMSGAVLESELLEDGVRRLVESPQGKSSGRGDEILEMIETVKDSQQRTREVLNAIRSLSGADAARTSVAEILGALARVVHSRAVPLADVTVEADGACTASISVPKLVGALVTILSEVLERAATGAHGARARLTLRAYTAVEATVVEIEDDAGEAFVPGPGQAGPLAPLRAAMNELGADVIVESTPERTVVRLLLPPAEEELHRTGEVGRLLPASERPN